MGTIIAAMSIYADDAGEYKMPFAITNGMTIDMDGKYALCCTKINAISPSEHLKGYYLKANAGSVLNGVILSSGI